MKNIFGDTVDRALFIKNGLDPWCSPLSTTLFAEPQSSTSQLMSSVESRDDDQPNAGINVSVEARRLQSIIFFPLKLSRLFQVAVHIKC